MRTTGVLRGSIPAAIFHTGLIQKSGTAAIILYLQCEISDKPGTAVYNGESINIAKNQCVTSIRRIADELGLSTKVVRSRLAEIVDLGLISFESTKHYSIATWIGRVNVVGEYAAVGEMK